AFLGLAPTFSTMPTPSAPSSDIWNHGSLAALRGLPSSGGILGQWTQLIGPPTSQTVWNSPTVRTRFLQPVSATTAQLNSNSYQSSVPAPRPSRLARMLDLPPHQWSRLIGLQPIKHPTKWVARPFSRQRPPGFRSLDPTAGTIPNPRRRPHQRTFGRDCVKPSPINYAGPGFSEFIDKLAALVPLLPGSGTAQSMQDGARAGKALEAGNYGDAALHFGAGVVNAGLDWLPAGKQLAVFGWDGRQDFSVGEA